MQRNRNKRSLIILVLLTAATLLTFWMLQPENTTAVDPDLFRLETDAAIDRVTLDHGEETIELSYDGSRWLVNGKHPADAGLIRVLFATLQQAVPKRPVAQRVSDSISSDLQNNGIQVSLYEGEALRGSFIAGGNKDKTQAYFAKDGSDEVYVMGIPGYRVYVSGIFELDESGWRDKYILSTFNWRNFKSLAADFPGRKTQDFKIIRQGEQFVVEGLQTSDTSRVNTYLDDVSLLNVENYLGKPEFIDSLKSVSPLIDIQISDVGNRISRFRIYGTENSKDYLGIIGDDQVALFDRRKVIPLLKARSYFTGK